MAFTAPNVLQAKACKIRGQGPKCPKPEVSAGGFVIMVLDRHLVRLTGFYMRNRSYVWFWVHTLLCVLGVSGSLPRKLNSPPAQSHKSNPPGLNLCPIASPPTLQSAEEQEAMSVPNPALSRGCNCPHVESYGSTIFHIVGKRGR